MPYPLSKKGLEAALRGIRVASSFQTYRTLAVSPSTVLLSPDKAQNLNPVVPALRLKWVCYHLTESLKSRNLPSNIERNIVNLLRASWSVVEGSSHRRSCEKQNLSVCKRFFLGMINEAQQKWDMYSSLEKWGDFFQRIGSSYPRPGVSETHRSESECLQEPLRASLR